MSYPGQSPQMQGQMQMMPGQMQLRPGQSQMMPGQMQTMPGQAQMMPGQTQMMPGQMQTMPGQTQLMPGQMQTMPGQSQMMPNQMPMTPGDERSRNKEPKVPIMPAPVPSHIPLGIPMGLEYLLLTDSILIKQQIELAEIWTGFNTNNRYDILDSSGRRIYFAAECSDSCGIMCMGNARAWYIDVLNFLGRPVMAGNRESVLCGYFGNIIKVASPSGYFFGSVAQNCNCVTTSWDITDETGEMVLRLEAPACSVLCPSCATCCEAEFPLIARDGQKIGGITKKFGGLLKEMATLADTFGIQFPVDLDVKLKAVLIFATFMIDFMFYEETEAGDGGHHHHHHRHRRY